VKSTTGTTVALLVVSGLALAAWLTTALGTWALLSSCSTSTPQMQDADDMPDTKVPDGYVPDASTPPWPEASDEFNTSGCPGPNAGCGDLWCFPECSPSTNPYHGGHPYQ